MQLTPSVLALSGGFDFHFRIRANVNIIVVNLPTFSLTLTSALLPALASAFSSAPDPKRIKALVLTNPHNPFGQCYPVNVLLECVRFCSAHAIHFISDEVYAMSGFASSAEPAVPFFSVLALDLSTPVTEDEKVDRSRVHVVWSISKDFGSSGIRMVRVLAPTHRLCDRLRCIRDRDVLSRREISHSLLAWRSHPARRYRR